MARRSIAMVLVAALLALSPAATARGAIALEKVADAIPSPTTIASPGDGTGRLFFATQTGRIFVRSAAHPAGGVFLDLSSLVSQNHDERGLLGLAFHPRYSRNGFFYVHYTKRSDDLLANGDDVVVARYAVSASDPDVADPSSARVLLTIPHRDFPNHDGGQLQFGPDRYLYIGVGDGGGGGDTANNAQNLGVLLGKILRIDVDSASPYAVPPSNPFVGRPGTRGEIWAYGLRNPWRFSFDRTKADLLIGDVGQNEFEEIDFQPHSSAGGENYGWRKMEGTHCFNPSTNCNDGTLVLPILQYGHRRGCSVTGGYRYRGVSIPSLYGRYLFADYCSGVIRSAEPDASGAWTSRSEMSAGFSISTFGEDEAGNLFVGDYSGNAVHRIVSTDPAPLFADDFADRDASDWSFSGGEWRADRKGLRGKSDPPATATAPFAGCSTCAVEADLSVSTPSGRVSLFGWRRDAENYVVLLVREADDQWVLKQVVDGAVVARVGASRAVAPGTTYHAKIVHDGSSFAVVVDGAPLLSMNAAGPANGGVAFRVAKGIGRLRSVFVH